MRKSSFRYPVEIVEDVFGSSTHLAETLVSLAGDAPARVLLVADENVATRIPGLGMRIGRYFQSNGIGLVGHSVIMPGGEKAKSDSQKSVGLVLSALTDRDGEAVPCVLALGGGSVLDAVGFAVAQTAMRVRLVRVPTTPAAMFGAAFADTVFQNCSGRKDFLALAQEPAAVFIDPSFAHMVLDGVWRGGMGEAVRVAAAADGDLFANVEQLAGACRERRSDAFLKLVEKVIGVWRRTDVSPFALCTASRLEELSGFKLPHGYAVPIALAVEATYAARRGVLASSVADRVLSVLKELGALDGLQHSRHLLDAGEDLCAARFAAGLPAAPIMSSEGVLTPDENPSQPLYLEAVNLIKYLT